ncbi:cupin domain-containing protein [Pontimicrobium sp. SW4]|uniref:Cupin domain-containing protein n=1 Tax=Pontimicrobium sp. SW4 TaxID=3153519 RepID=A0AAU7BU24_9FLAO
MKKRKSLIVLSFVFFININVFSQESEAVIIHSKDLVDQKVKDENKTSRVWNLKKDNTIRINLVEMKGELTKHIHPDADHSLIVIEGKVKVLVGEKIYYLEKGDFISIPKNIPHKYWTITKTALLASMDAPYYDPKKTIRLE